MVAVFQVLTDVRPRAVGIRQVPVDLRRDEEVGNHVVALGQFVEDLDALVAVFGVEVGRGVDIEIPLYDVAGVGPLFVDRLRAELAAHLVVFRVADIVDVVVGLVEQQSLVGVEVVHEFAVGLVGQSEWYLVVGHADEVVDDGFEHYVETLDEQILVLRRVDLQAVGHVEEGHAEIPELDGCVGEILVFYLTEAHGAVAVPVALEFRAGDEREAELYFRAEAVAVGYVLQYREVDDDQLLVEVYLPLLVDGVEIDGLAPLDNGVGAGYGLLPVDFVEARVEVFQYEGEILLILLVEADEGEDNVEQRLGGLALSPVARVFNRLVKNDGVLVRVVENDDSAVDPHGELVDEVALRVGQLRLVEVDDVLRGVMAEHLVVFVHQHFRQDIDHVAHLGLRIVVIPDVAQLYALLYVLKREKSVEHVLNVLHRVGVFFNQNLHLSRRVMQS